MGDDSAFGLDEFDRYIEEHAISEEDYATAFAHWVIEHTNGRVARAWLSPGVFRSGAGSVTGLVEGLQQTRPAVANQAPRSSCAPTAGSADELATAVGDVTTQAGEVVDAAQDVARADVSELQTSVQAVTTAVSQIPANGVEP